MAAELRELEEDLVRAGAQFLRYTGKAHKLYALESPATGRKRMVTLITHGLGSRNTRNQASQIKQLLRAHARENPALAAPPEQVSFEELLTPPVERIALDLAPGTYTEAELEALTAPEVAATAPSPAQEEAPMTTEAARYVCEECKAQNVERSFVLPQGLGRHRAAMHGVPGAQRAAARDAAEHTNGNGHARKARRPDPSVTTVGPFADTVAAMVNTALALQAAGTQLVAQLKALQADYDQTRSERDDLRKKMVGLQSFLGVQDPPRVPRAWER